MATYERTVQVEAHPERLFAFLAEVGNLPTYFEQMTSAERREGESVHTTAVIRPEGQPEREVEGNAWFRVNEAELKIEWGSEGPNDYHGELDVSPAGEGSDVTVRLWTERDGDEGAIEDGLERTLANVKRLAESG